jgi:hypothetical protein
MGRGNGEHLFIETGGLIEPALLVVNDGFLEKRAGGGGVCQGGVECIPLSLRFAQRQHTNEPDERHAALFPDEDLVVADDGETVLTRETLHIVDRVREPSGRSQLEVPAVTSLGCKCEESTRAKGASTCDEHGVQGANIGKHVAGNRQADSAFSGMESRDDIGNLYFVVDPSLARPFDHSRREVASDESGVRVGCITKEKPAQPRPASKVQNDTISASSFFLVPPCASNGFTNHFRPTVMQRFDE